MTDVKDSCVKCYYEEDDGKPVNIGFRLPRWFVKNVILFIREHGWKDAHDEEQQRIAKLDRKTKVLA